MLFINVYSLAIFFKIKKRKKKSTRTIESE